MAKPRPTDPSAGSPDASVSTNSLDSSLRYNTAQGLFEFCSSQAATMLAQFRNINQLIGPTNDWTAPGTLCEVLIRDLIRRILPNRYAVDKGFIFGRRGDGEREVHSPEIDVLIHDVNEYAPVYRLEDFVIVHPQAVRGVIQVKRTLDSGKLASALCNLVEAKRHLKAFGVTRTPNQYQDVFSAAIFFAEKLPLKNSRISKGYKPAIKQLRELDPLVRPHFWGSLSHRYYVVPLLESNTRYDGFPSTHRNGNASLATFLGYLTQYILPQYSRPQFFLPSDHHSDHTIILNGPPGSD